MFKTIFGKLITIFIVILIVAFSITGIMLNIFLDKFFTDEKAKALESVSDLVDLTFTNYLYSYDISPNADNTRLEKYLNDYLAYYGSNTYSIIWIVDSKGHLKKYSKMLPQTIISKYSDSSGYVKIPELSEKLETAGTTVKDVGDFNGFFKDPYFASLGDLWLTVGKSFTYQSTDGKDVLFTVYIHTPVPMVKIARNTVLEYFLLSVGVAVIIAVLLVYIFSLRLSKPLKQIKNAAAKISNGEFEKRLDIKSRDEIGELARTFNQMAAALQNLEEMRRGFIANVSHELRTPMTSIRGFVEGILDGTIPQERQNHYLTIVRDETNRLNRLVNDLLDLAKMEAGEMKLSLMPVDINELLRKCVIKLETLLLEKELTVDADFEEDDILVKADADAIERVVYNLIHNAIKFTPAGGNIKLLTIVQKDKVEVTVRDNGAGIDEEELEMIWDRFYKSDKSRSRDKTGTGLGLAIVRNIINEHSQKIWVESKAGEGTSFTFTLERACKSPDEQQKK
jgi:signal transduction histidine kinase